MATTKGTSAKTKTSKAKTAPKRDAYDDFLEIMDKRSETVSKGPKKKTTETAEPKKQTSKTTTAKKSGGTKSTTKKTTAKSKPKRDAYDDFLDLAEIREASQAKGSKKTAVTEKPEPKTAKRTSASKTSKTSTAKPKSASKRKPKTDAYDDFLAVVEAKENSRPVRRKKPKKGRGLTAALVCCILILGALFGYQGYQYSRFLGMKKAVTRATYYEGTTVDGIDVSTMTRDEAVEYWRVNVEQNYTARTVNVSGIGTLTAESLGYTSDYVAVLTNAYGAGRSGSLEERYALLSSRLEMPVAYSVNRQEYDPAIVTGFVTTAANAINREPTDAHIAS
ncbi:MAG: peptidoglycan binding domain-containing protein, partial [Clostridia bacterium]|nr:peptidoglycan binding domain-containing protein [Clostridia bacterium]